MSQMMLAVIYILLALLAAACYYGSVPHQRLWTARPNQKTLLRVAGSASFVLSVLVAAVALGWWAGFFAAFTALMLGCVFLPYLDAWRSQGSRADVG